MSLALGVPYPQLQIMINSRQFAEYVAFWTHHEPLESDRADMRSASIEATVANISRMFQKKAGRVYKIKDFLFDFLPKQRRDTTGRELKIKMTVWKSLYDDKRRADAEKKASKKQ